MGREMYTPEQRAAAVQLAKKIGVTAAARRLKIPITTISHWKNGRRRGNGTQSTPGVTASGGDSPGASMEQAKPNAKPDATSTSREGPSDPGKKPRAEPRPAKLYTPSQRAEALAYAAQEGVTAAATHFGISRFSLYSWRRRSQRYVEGKDATSPLVGSDENLAAKRDEKILAVWKSHPGLGPSQVRNQLRRAGLKVSTHTVRCVLEENGYVTPKTRRRSVHDQRYEAVRPNHLWHLDFLHRYVHKQKVYVLLILDDFSRFIVGAGLWDGERVAAVEETFGAAVSRHGKPEKVMSDGGSAFYSWKGIGHFTRLLDELETDQLIAKVPETNGKLEVLNANIQKELFNTETFFDLGEAQRRLTAWVQFYNFRRTHHALGGLLVPADRYFGRADEVLAHVEAGRSGDGVGDPLSAWERHLDLFRITSHRGQVEIYLMGTRLAFPKADNEK